MSDPNRCCSLCGESFDDRSWLLLNRYAIGTGTSSAQVEGVDEDGECIWDPDPAEALATGPVLHFPECLAMWLQAKAIQVDGSPSA